jgi:hypothetical protein
MNSGTFFEEVVELNRHFVKWGFAAYLFGILLAALLFIPAFFISMVWELWEDLQEDYNDKKRRALEKEIK